MCEDVEATLAALQSQYPHELVTVDITTDRELFARYHLSIPVIWIGEVELEAPITAVQLEATLAGKR